MRIGVSVTRERLSPRVRLQPRRHRRFRAAGTARRGRRERTSPSWRTRPVPTRPRLERPHREADGRIFRARYRYCPARGPIGHTPRWLWTIAANARRQRSSALMGLFPGLLRRELAAGAARFLALCAAHHERPLTLGTHDDHDAARVVDDGRLGHARLLGRSGRGLPTNGIATSSPRKETALRSRTAEHLSVARVATPA